jgi:S-formylglutathione hydrolase FrmB
MRIQFAARIGLLLAALIRPAMGEESSTSVSAAAHDDRGFLVHTVKSPFQAGNTQIRVLLPEQLEPNEKLPVIYVLPVEAANESRYGDGLLEIKRNDLHNNRRAIFVAPTFSHLPWYADHPTDPGIRQETYLLEVVVPLIDRTYPVVAAAKGRYLLGFSKSGWGAWSLLLRHPEAFDKAAAWDAPLMMDRLGLYGSSGIFGTQKNFDRRRIETLLRDRADQLQGNPRLALAGYGNFREHHQRAHQLLLELKIPHIYRDGPARKHDWHSGWVAEAVELLLSQSPPPK